MATKQQLKNTFVDGATVTGAMMSTLIDSLKGVQSPVSDPAASGNAIAFIATIAQDKEGVITATKKIIDLGSYQTRAEMVDYQGYDKQQTGLIAADGTNHDVRLDVTHNMKHYPTVRVIDQSGMEVRPSDSIPVPIVVTHNSINDLRIVLNKNLNQATTTYLYILD